MKKTEMVAPTRSRVSDHTATIVNRRIERETQERFEHAVEGGSEAILQRLDELDREWDVERTLQTNFALVSLTGLALGAFVDRRWYALPAVAGAFMVEHALQGWCPPVALIRRAGVRTTAEIGAEREALEHQLAGAA